MELIEIYADNYTGYAFESIYVRKYDYFKCTR